MMNGVGLSICFALIAVLSVILYSLFSLDSSFSDTAEPTMSGAAPVIIEAVAKQTATVIFLHGLGDTGHGWAAALKEIRLPYVKYICPTARTIPVTLNGGMRMPAWFDIKSLDHPRPGPDTEDGLRSAADVVDSLIQNEMQRGIDSRRILLGGFSQGGAVAFYAGLRFAKPLAGILALSSFFTPSPQFVQDVVANRNIPILQCHGEDDSLITLRVGQATATALKAFNPNHRLIVYPDMEHSSSPEEMEDVRKFIVERLPEQQSTSTQQSVSNL